MSKEFKMEVGKKNSAIQHPCHQDPLEIPEILHRVLSFELYISSFEDMTSVRHVSNAWREASLETWRSSATLQITLALINKFFEEEKQVFLNNGLFKTNEAEYVKFRLSEKPFQRYRIPFYHMTFPPSPARVKERFFWNKMGQHMRFLDLEQCLFDEHRGIHGLLWILLKKCPNLEELKMKPYRNHRYFVDELESLHSTLEDLWEGMCVTEEEDETHPDLKGAKAAMKLKTLAISSVVCSTTDGRKFAELFQDQGFVREGARDRYKGLCKLFMRLIPNLQNLCLEVEKSPVTLIEALMDLHQHQITSGQQVQLQNLKIVTITPDSKFFLVALRDYVVAVAPPIKNLTFRSRFPSTQLRNQPNLNLLWLDILRQISQTLVTLDITFDGFKEEEEVRPNREGIPLKYNMFTVQLPCLTHLTVRTNYMEGSDFKRPPSFNFLSFENDNMPELKHFRFESSGPNRFQDLVYGRTLSDGAVLPFEWDQEANVWKQQRVLLRSMENLEEFHYCGRFQKEALKILVKFMVNLKVLETIFSDDLLPHALDAFLEIEQINLLPFSRVSEECLQILRVAHPNIKINRI